MPGSLVGEQGIALSPIGGWAMVLVVVFGVALLIAVLLSGLAARTVLSTSFLFLVGGALTLIAVCIAFSIVAHSSTDVPIARLFHVEALVGVPGGDEASRKTEEASRVGT